MAGSRHENIRWLEVTVDDQRAVRVLHRVAHDAKQPEPRLERQTLRRAPFGDRNTVNQLHHEIGCAIGCEPAVEERRDVGMDQAGEHLALCTKPLERVGVPRARPHQLDSHFLPIVAVGAFGAVHRAHTAAAENAQKTPRAETSAKQRIGRLTIPVPIDDESFDSEGAVGAGGGQHRLQLVPQRDILSTRLRQEPSPCRERAGVRELEELLDPLPLHAVHDHSFS